MTIDDLLNLVIPSIPASREAAERLRAQLPEGLSAEAAARLAVKSARKWAAAAGAVTGLAASPLTFLPAAIADAAAMLRIEGQLAGVVTALLDPGAMLDEDAFRKHVLRIVFPGAVSQVLRRVGVQAGERAAKELVERALTRGMIRQVAEVAAKQLGLRISEKAIVSKTIPIVGAGIGAAWNWAELQLIGRRAIQYHVGGEPSAKRLAKRVRSIVTRSKRGDDGQLKLP